MKFNFFSGTKRIDKHNAYQEIRKDSFFLDQEKHEHYLKYGWCTVENAVTNSEIQSFLDTFNEISKLDGFELEKNLLNSGRLFNPEIRQKTQDVINKNAQTILPRMFDMTKTDTFTGGAYQVKPAHPESDLMTHQDSTVIDEENDYCLFVWVPFCDITMENGHIKTLDGSHLWGNTQRSLGVPWQFRNNIETLNKYMNPVLVNKGDVMVFDPALIHSSSPNFTSEVRHAVTITVLRKNYQLVYYFRNPELDKKLIEKYYVNKDFYLDYDFISKPDESIWSKEIVPYKDFDLSNRKIVKLIKQYAPQQ
ncbi:MAG: phytanoyl-CoA dioxygenase family protein [Chitinophagales bacterium]